MGLFRKVVLAAATVGVMGIPPAFAQTKWNLPAAYPPDNPHSENLALFAKDVAAATDNKLQITVHAGDLQALVSHVGVAAHTTNDSIVWIADRSVLFCGDLVFNGGTPFLLMGSVSGAIEVLERVIIPLEARTIVPGHGPVFEGTEPIEQTLDYLRFVQRTAAAGRAAGLTPMEAARQADLGHFAQWPDSERIAGNLHRAYAELDGAPPGAQIDVIAALTDMVGYNGGVPLTCLA